MPLSGVGNAPALGNAEVKTSYQGGKTVAAKGAAKKPDPPSNALKAKVKVSMDQARPVRVSITPVKKASPSGGKVWP